MILEFVVGPYENSDRKCHLHPEEDLRLCNLYKGVVEWLKEHTHF